MNKATFTTDFTARLNAHFVGVVFGQDLINSGQRLVDEMSPSCSHITEWEPVMAGAMYGALNKETLLKGTKVVDGITVAECVPSEDEIIDMLNAVNVAFDELPDSMKAVTLASACIALAVMEKAAA